MERNKGSDHCWFQPHFSSVDGRNPCIYHSRIIMASPPTPKALTYSPQK